MKLNVCLAKECHSYQAIHEIKVHILAVITFAKLLSNSIIKTPQSTPTLDGMI